MAKDNKNLDLANKIVDKLATITEWPRGYDIDMISVIGVRHESTKTDIKDAKSDAAKVVAGMLDRDELVLSDTWEKDNL